MYNLTRWSSIKRWWCGTNESMINICQAIGKHPRSKLPRFRWTRNGITGRIRFRGTRKEIPESTYNFIFKRTDNILKLPTSMTSPVRVNYQLRLFLIFDKFNWIKYFVFKVTQVSCISKAQAKYAVFIFQAVN